jgi:hypothetical protein
MSEKMGENASQDPAPFVDQLPDGPGVSRSSGAHGSCSAIRQWTAPGAGLHSHGVPPI